MLALVVSGCAAAPVADSPEYIELLAERDLLRGDLEDRDAQIEGLEDNVDNLEAEISALQAASGGSTGNAPTPADVTLVSVFALFTGDCFDVPQGDGDVEDVGVMDCGFDHEYEVYYEHTMAEGPFPGPEATLDEADTVCFDSFKGYVGSDYETSALGYDTLYPTDASWKSGDRIILCLLYDFNGGLLTGSMKGTGI